VAPDEETAGVTELAGTQLSSLLETLPGIATVLRSPVADAIVNLVKAGSGQAAFSMADAEELLRYAIRRNLIAADESDRVLAETRDFLAGTPRPVVVARPAPPQPPVRPIAASKPELKARKPVSKAVPIKKAVKPVKPAKAIPAKKKAKAAKTTAKARPAHKKK
jgi:hypothetical protein